MSKKVTIEIDDRFAGVLSITAVKALYTNCLNATTYNVDLSKGTALRIDDKGLGWQSDYKDRGNDNG